jgi:DNA-binding CsgD family transcriptional regulator
MGTDFAASTSVLKRNTREDWPLTAAGIAARFKEALSAVGDLVATAPWSEGFVTHDRYLTALGEHADAVIAVLIRRTRDDAFILSQEQMARLCLALVNLQEVRFSHRQAILEEKLRGLQVAQQLAGEMPDQIGAHALLQRAAECVCELPGLGRSMVFRREGSILRAEATHFAGKDEWARECQAFSVETPYALGPGRPEAEIIRRRVPAIVNDAMHDPNAFQPIVQKIETQNYVVAPIIAYGEVAATLHGDAYFDERAVDEADRDAVGALAESLGRTLERALAIERLHAQHKAAEELALSASMAVRGLSQLPGTNIRDSFGPASGPVGGDDVPDELTAGEREVLQLIIQGATNPDIARRLFISEDTVKSRVKRILRKLGASNRGQAVAIYLDRLGRRC